ncbi:MAG: UDP-N-acetylmuramoyl-L-alanine--D-glutamate ligase [Deltaproteobacteria bacterium]|nr:UDP-N-acetylmuramoyl-L-alanine--D-glutamate ligase [Deltaproteobacteria bacterium]
MGGHLLVVGMARSGVAAARLALRKGFRVVCTDRRPDAPRVDGCTHAYGEHRAEDFVNAAQIVVSPGVPARMPLLQQAIAAGVPAVGELGFAASYLDCPILAVSGTNGKSTTTHLLGQLMNQGGVRTFTGGNIGLPLSEAVDGGFECAAVEVSSYQMELPGSFRPRAAAILNLTPDHLERHGTMDNYGAHKCRMFARMGPDDAAIVPAGDPRLRRLADAEPGRRLLLGSSPGVRVQGDELQLSGVHDPGPVAIGGFGLPGAHNRDNLAAAVLLAVCGGLWRRDIDVSTLRGLPHRVELVGERDGVRFVDDSKATNVESALAAYLGWTGPFVALLGGQGKAGANYDALVEPLRRARAVICLGAEGPAIHAALRRGEVEAVLVPGMAAAVAEARRLAHPGDAVILSPACASFDEFTDFEHRGRVFRQLALDY